MYENYMSMSIPWISFQISNILLKRLSAKVSKNAAINVLSSVHSQAMGEVDVTSARRIYLN